MNNHIVNFYAMVASLSGYATGACRWCVVLAFLSVGAGHELHGQEPPNKIPDALDRPLQEAPAVEIRAVRRAGIQRLGNFAMDPERWNEMAYSYLGGSKAIFEQTMRKRIRRTMNRAELLCSIDESLREKVNATAEIELQRLDSEIAAAVSEAPKDPTQQEYQLFFQSLYNIVEPYAMEMHGQPNRSSKPKLWQKVFFSQLTSNQRIAMEEDEKKREAFRVQVRNLETVLKVARLLGLNHDQMARLENMARSQPNGWDSLDMAWSTLQAMPDAQLKELLTDVQRDRIRKPLEVTSDIQPVLQWNIAE